MLLHPISNSRPALLTAIEAGLTSFSAQDLGADNWRAHRVSPAEESSWTGRGTRGFRLREIRSLKWPFATLAAR